MSKKQTNSNEDYVEFGLMLFKRCVKALKWNIILLTHNLYCVKSKAFTINLSQK